MSHRRLVLAFAFTILFSVLGMVAFAALTVIPGSASGSPQTVSVVSYEYRGPSADEVRSREYATIRDAVVFVHDQAVLAWYQEGARQADERAAAAAKPTRPRATTVRSDPVSVPVGSGDATSAIANWFGDLYDSAVGVARCESGLNPGAISPGGGNWGLFQINTTHRADFEQYTGHPWADVLNADLNAMYARKLYNGNGWGPWACRWAA